MIDTTTNPPRPDDDPTTWAPALRGLLDEQDNATAELESLCQRQAELIEHSATDELLELLAHRQRLLESAMHSARRIEPFVERWEEFMNALGERERDTMVGRVRAIQERIDRIGSRDELDREALAKRRSELTSELADVGRSRGALAAYAGPGGGKPNPRFQDREG